MAERLVEQLVPLSKLIVNEVIIRLREDGYLAAGGIVQQAETKVEMADERELLNLARAARLLDHSYCWLSRNYRRLGLKPSRIGGKLLFHRTDVDALLKRQKVKRPGRPRLTTLGA